MGFQLGTLTVNKFKRRTSFKHSIVFFLMDLKAKRLGFYFIIIAENNPHLIRALIASAVSACAREVSSNCFRTTAIFSVDCIYLPTQRSTHVISPTCKSDSLNFAAHFEKQVFTILRMNERVN
jgi:hypothetical protein